MYSIQITFLLLEYNFLISPHWDGKQIFFLFKKVFFKVKNDFFDKHDRKCCDF